MGLEIRNCSISELEKSPNISELLEEYVAESSIHGLPHPSAKVDIYKTLESVGAIRVIAAFYSDILIGYVIVLCSVLPHYSEIVATTESFFVAKKYRKTGAGLRLLREAEEYAKKNKSAGLLVSAPLGGVLAEVLPNFGYRETNRVFFRSFSHE